MNKLLLGVFIAIVSCVFARAQAPNISYASPKVYSTGTAITNLTMVNTGGAVPNVFYGQVNTIAGKTGVSGSANGPAGSATFNYPYHTVIDANGNLYVSELFSHKIRKINPAGVVSDFVGSESYGSADGQGSAATFVNISGMTIDALGNIYVSDQVNNLIRKITPGGLVSTFAGAAGVAGADNGVGTSARFNGPNELAVDKDNNVYVADLNNYLIRKITPAGVVSTFAGRVGVSGHADGPVATATIAPWACAVDNAGNVFITEGGNRLIRKITPSGTVSTIAGSGLEGTADGIGTAASFVQPQTIVVNKLGDLFVVDGSGGIRKISADATVTTLAGVAGQFGSTDGIGPQATFGYIGGMAIDAAYNLYLPDLNYHTIRKLTTTGYFIDKPLPTGLVLDTQTGAITGTPTVFTTNADYKITAYNTQGSSTSVVNLSVNGTLNFPPIDKQVYGAADFGPANSTSGLIELSSSDTSVAANRYGKVHIKGVGTCVITVTNGNTTISQPLTVLPAPLNVIADNFSKSPNTTNPAFTVSYSGFVYDDAEANLTTLPTITSTATATSAAGSYPITASGAASPNYKIAYTPGTLTVLGGNVTIVAPAVKYTAWNVFTVGKEITPLTPTNTGGNVPAAVYNKVTTVAGLPNVQGSANGTGAAASFRQPYGAALDAGGNLYVTDQSANLVRKITPSGVVTTLAGSGAQASVTGTGTGASFNFPSGIAVSPSGDIIVADQGSGLLRKITPEGVVTNYAGGGNLINGSLSQSSFSAPNGLAYDRAGNLFVSEIGSKLIRKITPAGIVSTFGGQYHVQGSIDGSGTTATFMQPTGIATDAFGNVYVTDGFVIRKITSDGVVSTLAGSGVDGASDGIGKEATFSVPQGIAVDASGIVYVMERYSLRKITPDGKVTTITGVGGQSAPTDGIGTDARFSFAKGLAINATGDLYAVDGQTIRKISLNGYSINKPLPAGLNFEPTTGIISGTPTIASPATDYVITANNINGGSTTSVNIKVTSIDASLANLLISNNTLSPSFASATLYYNADIASNVSSISLTPFASDKNSHIMIDGVGANSGTVSGDRLLTPGNNFVTIEVTAGDGSTKKVYGISITRHAASTNANLSNIASTPSSSLDYTGTPYNYSITVANNTGSVMLIPTAQESHAIIKVNNVVVASGVASQPIALTGNSTPVDITVTAEDGKTVVKYKVTVLRNISNNAGLSGIGLNPASNLTYTGTPYSYTLNVASTVNTVNIIPTAQESHATIKVNGVITASGAQSQPIALAGNNTQVTITVLAEDGTTTTTYNVGIFKVGSNNAGLSNINLNPASKLDGTSTPYSYTMNVPGTTTAVNLTAIAQESHATIKINGLAVASGSQSQSIALTGTNTPVTIIVTAEDGTTTQTFQVTIIKVGSNNANLSGISLNPASVLEGTGTPYVYTMKVVNTTTSVNLIPTAQESHATIKVNGVVVASGNQSQSIDLTGTTTQNTIAVTAGDGTTTLTYQVAIIKVGSNNANLSGISLNPASKLESAGVPYSYKMNVVNTTTSVNIIPTAQESHATIKVNGITVANGNLSQNIPLTGATTQATIVVTAEDGVTTQTYQLAIIKTGSGNALLSGINLNPASQLVYVSPYNYTMQVPNGTTTATMTAFVQESHAVIKINNVVVPSGSPSGAIGLTGTNTQVTIFVTAEDATSTQTYYVTIIKAAGALNVITADNSKILKDNKDNMIDPVTATIAINVHQAVSPNGDGINDVLSIEGITQYPDNKLLVMNRSGEVIFTASGYNNSSVVFDGHASSGKMQRPGTYFYSLEYKQGKTTQHTTGFIVVNY